VLSPLLSPVLCSLGAACFYHVPLTLTLTPTLTPTLTLTLTLTLTSLGAACFYHVPPYFVPVWKLIRPLLDEVNLEASGSYLEASGGASASSGQGGRGGGGGLWVVSLAWGGRGGHL
jgi:hypothetical protein